MKNLSTMRITTWILLALAAGAVAAQESKNTNVKKRADWYAGGSLGTGGFKTGYGQTANTIFSTGATSVTVVPDVKETMWKLYMGYQFSPLISVEGGYWNFGNPSYTANISAPVVTSMRRSFKVDGYGADTVIWLPITSGISGFGKAGAILTNSRASTAVPGGGLTTLPAESARKFDLRWGLGAQYEINNGLALRLEYETVRNVGDSARFGTADIVLWSFGLNYKY